MVHESEHLQLLRNSVETLAAGGLLFSQVDKKLLAEKQKDHKK